MAPMSDASMTLNPTHAPAKASLAQRTSIGVVPLLLMTKASAQKPIPIPICCGATPQQAVLKNTELSMAPKAPTMRASGDSFSCLKNAYAPNPRINKAMGGKNFA